MENRGHVGSRAARAIGTVVCVGCLAYFCVGMTGRWGGVGTSLGLMAGRPWLMVAEVALMLLGVGVETLRWAALRSGFMGGRLTDDLLATLRSIALGNSTPLNLGEHVGRGMTYARHRMATVLSLLSSVVQTAAILLLGFAGGLAVRRLGMDIPVAGGVAAAAALVACLFGAAMVWRRRRRWLRAARALGLAFGLAVVKVLMFSFQMFLLLRAGGGAGEGLFAAVLFYYLCVTVSPRVNIVDIGVKGAWAVAVFGPWVCEECIVAATVLMWLINIVAPTLTGYAVLLVGRLRRA